MIKLSYTSLNNIHNGHEWLNKQMGIPVPDYPFLKAGEKAHRIIQDHVSGKAKHQLLEHIDISFPVVEEESDSTKADYWEKKEACKFSFEFEGYEIHGYADGLNKEEHMFLEIKSSSSPWSLKQFKEAMQRKIYALALSKEGYTKAYLITGKKDPELWKQTPPLLFPMSTTGKDLKDAEEYIREGIRKLEAGEFNGGLDENGKCTGCFWNMARYQDIANCHFM